MTTQERAAACDCCGRIDCRCCAECDNPQARYQITTATRGESVTRYYCGICYLMQP